MNRSAEAQPTTKSDTTDTSDVAVLTFSNGLPGFPEVRNFVLVNTELAQDPFSILKCLDVEDLEFVVVPPALFFGDYAPVLDDVTVKKLEIESAEEVLLLSILTVGASAAEVTANLLAPVVINTRNRQAAQVVLATQDFPIDAKLFDDDITGVK